MAARVTQHVVEAIFPVIARSPTSITGAGISQHVVEAIVLNDEATARVTQHVVEVIVAGDYDGTHGDTGGGTASPVTTTYGYAI